MAVYVDDFRVPARVKGISGRWSHMTADSREELHAFAARIGLQRKWFQDPVAQGKAKPGTRFAEKWHYDVTDSKRLQALELGAVAISWRDLPVVISRRIEADRAAQLGLEPADAGEEVER